MPFLPSHQPGVMVHCCNLSDWEAGGAQVQSQLQRHYLKNKIQNKRAKGVAQMVGSLPNVHRLWIQSLVLQKRKGTITLNLMAVIPFSLSLCSYRSLNSVQ
jgi:hypothetical protein